MAHRFLATRSSARARKACLVCVIALAILIAWAAAALTQTSLDKLPWVDMMRPDARTTGTVTHIIQKQHGKTYAYAFAKTTSSSATLTRNGKLWVTIRKTPDGVYDQRSERHGPDGDLTLLDAVITVFARER